VGQHEAQDARFFFRPRDFLPPQVARRMSSAAMGTTISTILCWRQGSAAGVAGP
jgi:hypothetical protein